MFSYRTSDTFICVKVLLGNKLWSPYQDSNLDLTSPNGKCNLITLYGDKLGTLSWERSTDLRLIKTALYH